jgi:2-methylcitrate dehydratase
MDQRIRELSKYAHELSFGELPAAVVHECKRKLIDTLGCAIGAFDAEPSRIARAVAQRYSGDPSARIFGTLQPSSAEHAAFANGVMIRYADYNDSYYKKSSGHPSDTLAAVLAIGDAVHADGKAVVTATILAYEVFCNFSDVMPPERGWDYVVHGVVAGALASGKLLGLNVDKLAQAIALAVTPNMALEQTRVGELSMWKGCASGNAARNAIFAALLAQQGLTGPAEAIEGRWGLQHAMGRFEWAPFGGRGGPFRLAETHLKYYPAVVHSQSPIAAAIELHAQVKPKDIQSIVVDTYWVAKRYTDRASPLWQPRTRETADHSLPYIIAAALIDGTVSEASFSDERLHDARIKDLLAKTTLRENPDYTRAHPSSWPCRIEITTRSGERKAAQVDYFKGHAKNPLSDAEVEGKFRELTEARLAPGQAGRILEKAWNVDRLTDIGELIGLLSVTDPAA